MSEKKDKTVPETKPVEETAPGKTDAKGAEEALDRFLSRENESGIKSKQPSPKRNLIVILVAAAVVAALTGVIIFLNNKPETKSTPSEDLYTEAWTIATVDEAGLHTVTVPTDAAGEPQKNGSGTLIDYVPARISGIHVENADGSFTIEAHTHEGEATEYTIKGYEGLPLEPGIPDDVANDAAALQFQTIAGVGKNPADFGLEEPRATVWVSYTDGTSARINVGSEAPSSAGVYLSFGDAGTVYLVDSEAVDSFFYRPADFISLEVTDAADSVENAAFRRITLKGSRYPQPIVLEPNTDQAVNYYYQMTSPNRMFTDAVMSGDIAGSIRDIRAENVIAVNDGSEDAETFLSHFGLNGEGYAEVTAEYPDATIRLRASAPDGEGYVYLVNLDDPKIGKRVVYQIQIGAVSWASASLDRLTPDTILSVSRTAIGNITASADGKTYSIDVDTRTQTVETDTGDTEEVTTTEAYYNDKLLGDDSFTILQQNLSGMPNDGPAADADGTALLEIRYTYTTGRAPDVLRITDVGTKEAAVTLNGSPVGTTPMSYVSTLIENLHDIDAGSVPKSL